MVPFFVEKDKFVKNIINPLHSFGVGAFTLNVENDLVYCISPKPEVNSVFFGFSDIMVPGFVGDLRFAELVTFKRAIDNLKSDVIKFNVFDNHITCSDDNGYAFKLYLMSDLNKNRKMDKDFFLKFPCGFSMRLDKKKFQELSSLNSLASETKKLYINDDGDAVRFLFSDKEKAYASEFDKKYKKDECAVDGIVPNIQINSELFSWVNGKDADFVTITQSSNNSSLLLINTDKKYYLISQLEK